MIKAGWRGGEAGQGHLCYSALKEKNLISSQDNQPNIYLLWEQSRCVRAGRRARGEPSLSKQQWVTVRLERAGQGLGEGTEDREEARRSSRETEQWSTLKERSEPCRTAKSPTN